MVILTAFRWQILLRAQAVRLTFARAFELGMIGSFFNLALPGGISGDVLKAYYVSHENADTNRSRILASIVVDRIVGMSALVLVAAGALAVGRRSLASIPNFRALGIFILAATLGVFAFFSYVACLGETRDPLLNMFRRPAVRWPRLGIFLRFYEGVRAYHLHRAALFGTLALSVLIHLLGGWACFHIALALGETQLSLLPVLLVFPLGTLVNIVPLAPAGIGTGHGAFLYLFELIGSVRGADVYSFLALITLLSAGIGGIFYLRFKKKEPENLPPEGTSVMVTEPA